MMASASHPPPSTDRSPLGPAVRRRPVSG
jgi:hypothetical protein